MSTQPHIATRNCTSVPAASATSDSAAFRSAFNLFFSAFLASFAQGLHLLAAACRLTIPPASIALDNTAVIQASTLSTSAAGRYLVDASHSAVRQLKRRAPGLKLTLRRSPGHDGIEGNERAYEEAKIAAGWTSSPGTQLPALLRNPLPTSASSLKRKFSHHLNTAAAALWNASRHGRRMAELDPSLPSKHYAELVSAIPRRHASLLIKLRTGHVPLQAFLARIGKAIWPTCATCREAP